MNYGTAPSAVSFSDIFHVLTQGKHPCHQASGVFHCSASASLPGSHHPHYLHTLARPARIWISHCMTFRSKPAHCRLGSICKDYGFEFLWYATSWKIENRASRDIPAIVIGDPPIEPRDPPPTAPEGATRRQMVHPRGVTLDLQEMDSCQADFGQTGWVESDVR
jgi:hypothetical protein